MVHYIVYCYVTLQHVILWYVGLRCVVLFMLGCARVCVLCCIT